MGNNGLEIIEQVKHLFGAISSLPRDEAIEVINTIKIELHSVSPFVNEPVDCVLWVRNDAVQANDYNPNKVAPPEMKLLEHSIQEDGYTQPVVTWLAEYQREVVDGFHRSLIGKESRIVLERTFGYLPVTTIRSDRTDRGDRIAATIRHNRARGKHLVSEMSDIVTELAKRNWSDNKIGKELGMEPDEVLRLRQIGGLAEMFADEDFSEAWEVELDNSDES